MSNKFTRNITGTKLKGEIKEPFTTNVQNDLLSDDTDVYVRQERSKKINNQYHCLTDNVKEVISNSDLISTVNFDHEKDGQEEKNKSYINVNKSNKSESEKMESNSHVMTPLQTGYSIEKNNRDVIPSLVKEHETPTEIESKSERIDVKKIRKNEFEIDFNEDDLATKDYVDDKIDDIDIGGIDTSEFVKRVNLVKPNSTGDVAITKSHIGLRYAKNLSPYHIGSHLQRIIDDNVITIHLTEQDDFNDGGKFIHLTMDDITNEGEVRNIRLFNDNISYLREFEIIIVFNHHSAGFGEIDLPIPTFSGSDNTYIKDGSKLTLNKGEKIFMTVRFFYSALYVGTDVYKQ